MPMKDTEKLQLFADEAIGEAEATAAKLSEQTAAERRHALDEGEEKLLSAAYDNIQAHITELRRATGFELSRRTMENRKEYLLAREALIQQVLERARAEIERFTESGEYGDYLVRLCRGVLAQQTTSFTVFLSQRDMRYKFELLAALESLSAERFERGAINPVYSVRDDKNIKLGGARFYSADGGIIINETLDELLRTQKDYLTLRLGRFIGDAE